MSARDRMLRVSRDRRCPICGKSDWCLVTQDGSAAICARVEQGSRKRCGEAGWLHVLRRTGEGKQTRLTGVRSIQLTKAGKDFQEAAKQYTAAIRPDELATLARQLGVSKQSLERLEVGRCHNAFTFPMKSDSGKIIGIRLRSLNGHKLALKGSRQGLFVPMGLPKGGPLLICEGPTDTAAALDLGFSAVGRPSCNGGGRLLTRYARGRDVVIVADGDLPGRRGAGTLSAMLLPFCNSVRVICPPENIKDLRAWKRSGATHEDILDLVAETSAYRPSVRNCLAAKSH